jgi:hypothetical protein
LGALFKGLSNEEKMKEKDCNGLAESMLPEEKNNRKHCRILASLLLAVFLGSLVNFCPAKPLGVSQKPKGAAATPAPSLSRFSIQNLSPYPRREVVQASIPFPKGQRKTMDGLSVQGHPTTWKTLTRWGDGSCQWGQARFVANLEGGKTKFFRVIPKKNSIPKKGFQIGGKLLPLLAAPNLETEVEDSFGVIYRCRINPGSREGSWELLEEGPLVMVYRFRGYHYPADPSKPGIGRDFLSLTAYITVYRGFDHAKLVLFLGNDYQGRDNPGSSKNPNLYPLGTVRFRRFSLLVHSDKIAFVPRFIRENGLRPPTPLGGARGAEGFRQDLLGPDEGLYLGDATRKGFPLILFAPSGRRDQAAATSEETLKRQTAHAMALFPLRPLPDLNNVRKTGAMNAHGGPAPATPDLPKKAIDAYQRWVSGPHFGPFGAWGDVAETGTTGTPRNRVIGLDLTLRSGNPLLMRKAEGFCLQQQLRPYHLFGLVVDQNLDVYLAGLPLRNGGNWVSGETLGRKRIPKAYERYREGLKLPWIGPYGMNAYDYEHFTVDILYDYFCLTGSPWVREELRLLGQHLKGLLTPKKYNRRWVGTSRGEGWCMKALALCFYATGDPSLKRHGIERLHKILDRDRGKGDLPYASRQYPHPNAFGKGVYWDAPWQQGAYVMGMHACFQAFGDPLFRTLAIDVAKFMAGPGWVEGVGPKYFVNVDNPKQYKLPVGYGPLGGTGEFENPAFVLAAELAETIGKIGEEKRFMDRAWTILEAHAHRGMGDLCANKWFQIHMDRFPSGRRPH